jgi:hypothetical protein
MTPFSRSEAERGPVADQCSATDARHAGCSRSARSPRPAGSANTTRATARSACGRSATCTASAGPRRTVGRQLQAERRGLAAQHRARQRPGRRKVSSHAQQRDADHRPAVEASRPAAGTAPPMKIVAIRICVGQRPLHSEKLLVMIAISRSRGLSIMRVATTPAALQPKPMHIVSACLPCAPQRRNSPVQVERHARQVAEVLEQREQRKEDRHRRQHHADHPGRRQIHAVDQQPSSHHGMCSQAAPDLSARMNRLIQQQPNEHPEGTLAPAMVSQKHDGQHQRS